MGDKVLVGANPIKMPPIEVCAEGTKAILSYLSRVLSQCQSTDHGLMRGAASVFNVSIPSYSSAHGPAGEYTVFEVMVSTSGGGWCVHRRFSEFDTLRSAIIARLPSAQIPVLPPKAGLLQDNLDAEFLDDR